MRLIVISFLGSSVAALLLGRVLSRGSRGGSRIVSGGACILYVLLLLWRPDSAWISNPMVILAGSSIGFLLSLLLSSTASVLAFLLTAAVVDLLSFSGGLTNTILSDFRAGGSGLLSYMAVFVETGGQTHAVIGVGDLAILTASYLGFHRATGLDTEPALWLLGGLSVALGLGLAFGGLPGIPFIAGGALFFVAKRKWLTPPGP